jgi:hypothetical protein
MKSVLKEGLKNLTRINSRRNKMRRLKEERSSWVTRRRDYGSTETQVSSDIKKI